MGDKAIVAGNLGVRMTLSKEEKKVLSPDSRRNGVKQSSSGGRWGVLMMVILRYVVLDVLDRREGRPDGDDTSGDDPERGAECSDEVERGDDSPG